MEDALHEINEILERQDINDKHEAIRRSNSVVATQDLALQTATFE